MIALNGLDCAECGFVGHDPNGSFIPRWLWLAREGEMEIDNLVRKCVAFVGMPIGGGFDVAGTAFFLPVRPLGMDLMF